MSFLLWMQEAMLRTLRTLIDSVSVHSVVQWHCSRRHFIDEDLGVYDGCFLGLRDGRNQDDLFGHCGIETLQLRDEQRGFGNRPGGHQPQTLIVVPVSLFEYFNETGGTRVIHALARGFVFEFIDAAFRINRIDHFSGIRIHHHHLPRLVQMSTLNTATNEQAVMGRVEGYGVRLGSTSDWPGGYYSALVAVNDQ